MNEPIYLDNNATTRVADKVLDAMTPYYRTWYGNAHAAHQLGQAAHAAVEAARAEVARLVGAAADDVIFTSCGTEGNAMVIRGLLDRVRGGALEGRRRIITTAVEHPSVLTLLRALESAGEIELAIVPVNRDGSIDLDRLAAELDARTLLVSVMLAQNETGVIHPVRRIADLAHAAGAFVHVDAVQAAGKIAIDCDSLGADFLTISGHKLHAPKGVGALVRAQNVPLAPLWYGGGQELGLRSGTEPVPSIAGFGVAARIAREHLDDFAALSRLRDRFEALLFERLDDISLNGAAGERLPNTSNVSFHGLAADELVRMLDANGICVSAGAACNSGKVEPSATMKAMGKPLREAMGAVRFSLSRYTTQGELDRAVEIVSATVTSMRGRQSAG
jgi:cysteine desulfurase